MYPYISTYTDVSVVISSKRDRERGRGVCASQEPFKVELCKSD